ncbi:MAG: hypothetical protein AAF352_05865, partial [Pseudomonadota bacterium]
DHKLLQGLQLSPPTGFDGELQLTIRAIATDPNLGLFDQLVEQMRINVDAVASTITLKGSTVTTAQDSGYVSLGLIASIDRIDADRSERVYGLIAGLPAGARLSHGEQVALGQWRIAAHEFDLVQVRPASGSQQDFTLQVTSVVEERYAENTTATQITSVIVDLTARSGTTQVGGADAPVLSAQASAQLGGVIALDISASIAASDTVSTSLDVIIHGLPVGAVLSKGATSGNGEWTVDFADLGGLELTPGASSDDFTLSVEAVARAGANHLVSQSDITVDAMSKAALAIASTHVSTTRLEPHISITNTHNAGNYFVRVSGSGQFNSANNSVGSNLVITGGKLQPLSAEQLIGLQLDNAAGVSGGTIQYELLSVTPPANAITATVGVGNGAAGTKGSATYSLAGLFDTLTQGTAQAGHFGVTIDGEQISLMPAMQAGVGDDESLARALVQAINHSRAANKLRATISGKSDIIVEARGTAESVHFVQFTRPGGTGLASGAAISGYDVISNSGTPGAAVTINTGLPASGTLTQGEIYVVTVGKRQYAYEVQAGDTTSDVLQGLTRQATTIGNARLFGLTTSGTQLTISNADAGSEIKFYKFDPQAATGVHKSTYDVAVGTGTTQTAATAGDDVLV